jgi:hypothetical protein
MQCHRLWDREILGSMVTKAWVNTVYKSHREQVLFDRERAMLPATQERAQAEIAARKLDRTNGQLVALVQQMQDDIRTNEQMARRMRYLGRVDVGRANENAPITARAPSRFMRGCPKDGCRGFIRSNMVCGICDTRCCQRCLEMLPNTDTPNHCCKPEDVETANMLRQETRPCPKCASPIFKLDGCDQMWCTACNTAFSWRTGIIETGRVHNPHFYEWMRQGGREMREPGDIPCGGLPDIIIIRHWMSSAFGNEPVETNPGRAMMRIMEGNESTPLLRRVYSTHRNIVHAENVLLHRFRPEPINNTELRVAFLVGDISEVQMRAQLQKKEKAFRKQQAIHSVLEMMTVAAGDVYRNHLAKSCTEEAVNAMMDELEQLRTFGNESMKRVQHLWDCKAPTFGPLWYI